MKGRKRLAGIEITSWQRDTGCNRKMLGSTKILEGGGGGGRCKNFCVDDSLWRNVGRWGKKNELKNSIVKGHVSKQDYIEFKGPSRTNELVVEKKGRDVGEFEKKT